MAASNEPPVEPGALIRSRQYRFLLVLAAIIGVLVSLASWSFLALVHEIQVGIYEHLPGEVGYETVPWWWPLPWLGLAGVLTAFAILRLPGHGGHVPAEGCSLGWRWAGALPHIAPRSDRFRARLSRLHRHG